MIFCHFNNNGDKSVILIGDLVAPYSLLEPSVVDKDNDKIDNEDNTLLLVGNDNIINLYKRYKDIETKELTEDIQADKTPELSSLIQSMIVLNEMFFDLTTLLLQLFFIKEKTL